MPEPAPPAEITTVAQLMSEKVVCISADDTLRIVHDIMEMAQVRHLPVVRAGRLVGVMSQRDLLRASLSNVIGIPKDEQNQFLEGVKITDVMSIPPISVTRETPIKQAALTMAERKIGCLPVVEAGAVVGIITETDLLHACADRL